MMMQYFDKKNVDAIVKEIKRYLKEGKTYEEISELLECSYDEFDCGGEISVNYTMESTKFCGNFLKKNLNNYIDIDSIKKITNDIENLSITFTIIENDKCIVVDTPCIIKYKDDFIEKIYYTIGVWYF